MTTIEQIIEITETQCQVSQISNGGDDYEVSRKIAVVQTPQVTNNDSCSCEAPAPSEKSHEIATQNTVVDSKREMISRITLTNESKNMNQNKSLEAIHRESFEIYKKEKLKAAIDSKS